MTEPPVDALALLEAEPPVRVLDDDSSLPAQSADGGLRCRISGLEINGEEALLAALAAELAFPSYFGGNWDALLDSLRDLSWLEPEPASVRLLLDGAAEMFAAAPRASALLLETWIIAALWWAERGVPFQLCLLIER